MITLLYTDHKTEMITILYCTVHGPQHAIISAIDYHGVTFLALRGKLT